MADDPRAYDKHRYPNRYFRPEPTLYERARAILAGRGSNVNDYLEECLRRLVEDEGAGTPRQGDIGPADTAR